MSFAANLPTFPTAKVSSMRYTAVESFIANVRYTAVESFIANVLKCKAFLIVKFKCISIAMYSLVMSPFLRIFIKAKKYQKCLNFANNY